MFYQNQIASASKVQKQVARLITICSIALSIASCTASSVKTQQQVYITKTGKKYHTANCGALASSKTPLSLSLAKQKGFTPCKRCNAPIPTITK